KKVRVTQGLTLASASMASTTFNTPFTTSIGHTACINKKAFRSRTCNDYNPCALFLYAMAFKISDYIRSAQYGTFRYETDREKGANTVYFGSKIVNIDNPIVNRIENYQISVQCEVHYYGSDCSKFCQPRSDYNGGHYYCDMDGNKICKPTYNLATGCREKFCSSEPCKNGGRCIDLPDKFVCKCRPSFGVQQTLPKWWYLHRPCRLRLPRWFFHGDACQLDVDECRSISPCRGKGSVCENWFGTYSCHCGPGLARPELYRGHRRVQNNGYPTCFKAATARTRQAALPAAAVRGFSGRQCQEDVDECRLGQRPCSNETEVCQNLLGGFVCMCRDGFQAPNCTQKWPELLESLSASIPLWPPVLVAALAVSALTAILRCSDARAGDSELLFQAVQGQQGIFNNGQTRPDERGDAPDELYSYNEPQEAADVRRPVENTGQELPPPLPPRPLKFRGDSNSATDGMYECRTQTDRVRNKNSLDFGSRIVNIRNPIVCRVTNYARWVKVTVRVYDYDSVFDHDLMGTFSHKYSADARPFDDNSPESAQIRLTDEGKSKAE
uniref:Delta-like protein n=1 Tax=Macrostomum lignano TaxID=282301 RepID=A0A1I8FTZ8_9PLAT